jgi:hypothetical protein
LHKWKENTVQEHLMMDDFSRNTLCNWYCKMHMIVACRWNNWIYPFCRVIFLEWSQQLVSAWMLCVWSHIDQCKVLFVTEVEGILGNVLWGATHKIENIIVVIGRGYVSVELGRWGPFVHLSVNAWVNMEQRWNDIDRRKPKYSEKKPVTAPLCPPRIPRGLNWIRTQAFSVRSRRPSDWAITQS